MRKIIPVIFLAATLFVGCKSTTMSTTTGASTTTTNAVAATPPVVVGPNTPAQTTAENLKLGDLAGAFLVILTVLAVKRC